MYQSVESLKDLGTVLSQKSTVNESGKGLCNGYGAASRAGREVSDTALRYVGHSSCQNSTECVSEVRAS